MTFRITLTGRVTPADKARNDYLYVPFDLPTAASRLHVRYRYWPGPDSNIIDIGIFDPAGADFPGGAGFRGWSGAARSEFFLAPDAATPGYLPGPLPAGRYQVILGLYQLQPEGADYEIRIEADLQTAQPPSIGDRSSVPSTTPTLAVSQSRFWLRGDLHSHTEHSDAKGTLEQLVARAHKLKLDFLAITDHNTVSHHRHLPALAGEDPLLIAGQEVTTYYGHMNVWGTSRWCDFRCRTDDELAQVVALAHAHGGICSINHPKQAGPPWEYGVDVPVDAFEVWQAPWPWHNTESLALWDRLLMSGRRLPGVGGSDFHCPADDADTLLRLGWPTTWVKVNERSVAAILDAIKAGRVSIGAAPDGPRLDMCTIAGGTRAEMGASLPLAPGQPAAVEVQVEGGAGWTLRLVADGAVAAEMPVATDLATLHAQVAARRYVRAELVGDAPRELLPSHLPSELDLRGWRWALSNPIFIDWL